MSVTISSPFPMADVPRVWGWLEPFRARVSDDYSPKTIEEFIPYMLKAMERQKTWAVYRSGELGGLISYEQVSPVVGSMHVIFKKPFWGHPTTVPAIREAVAEMFKTSQKLSLPVMEGNLAMISLLKKIGATREGVLRGHTTRNGKPLDLIMMALFPATAEMKEAA